ncbi:MAG: YicC/YloC family endoribonuclease [Pseudomonadota bacterium]
MTGFARAQSDSPIGQLSFELRTVNHRYLDAQFRLPEPLRRFEHDMRKCVSQHLSRGKFDCTISVVRDSGTEVELGVDDALLSALGAAIETIQAHVPGSAPASATDLLRWPGVLKDPLPDETVLRQAALDGLTHALTRLAEMRADEGRALAGLLLQRCDELARLGDAVRERRPQVLTANRQKLDERLGRLDLQVDPARLEAELAIAAQKLDVDEELDRLTAHIGAIRDILAKGGPSGRKLDFLIQELNREANTLASKSADAATTAMAVDMKVSIEQMREQVQNIE